MCDETITGRGGGDPTMTTTHCKTSSKSKAYPLEFNIRPRSDPLLTVRPSQTRAHSMILDSDARLPMWRKEKHIPCSIRKQFYRIIFPPHPNYLGWSCAMHFLNLHIFSYLHHFSYFPPQVFLYLTQLTAGVLTKQSRSCGCSRHHR